MILSNRLPVAASRDDAGRWRVEPSPGGLVTALAPVLGRRGGLWVGWPGTTQTADLGQALAKASKDVGYNLVPLPLSAKEFSHFYLGFSNEILWPLFHDLQSRCNFDPSYWRVYQSVNRKFAEKAAKNAAGNDLIWIQDYHLMLVARQLRLMGVKNKVALFLHIPFPSPDIFLKLPWRLQILEALLDHDLIGFQTWGDRNNFIRCVETLMRGLKVDSRMSVSTIPMPSREVRVGAFPISIDFKEVARQGADKGVASEAQKLRAMHRRHLVLGVDRLDYSKGIPERLRSFSDALHRYPGLRGEVSLIQVVSPSRADIPEYRRLKNEIEGLVGEINGRFTRPGWIPVHYVFRSFGHRELFSYYRAADVALITPLKDGMNLIAKEYCAANVDENGVLVLSEFAGAASQLRRGALLVNPYDIEGVADTIYQACTMADGERRLRMRHLRQSIARRDIFWWADSFLRVAAAAKPGRVQPVQAPSQKGTPQK